LDGLACKARLDCLQAVKNTVWDIKTTASAAYKAFERSMLTYCYHQQAAWYLDGASRCGLIDGPAAKFLFLAVENSAPFNVAVYQASGALLNAGHQANEAALDLYRKCATTKHFPASYADEIIVLDCPAWMQEQEEALEA
jgi:hypothetical protein